MSSWMQMVLPPFMALKASQWPAPCMNGGAGSSRAPPLLAASTTCSRLSHSPPVARFRPPMAPTKMSAWRHSTPLGMPVVPPV